MTGTVVRGRWTTPMRVAVVSVAVLVAAGIVLIVMLTAASPPAAESGPTAASPTALPTTAGPHPGATPTTGSEVLPPSPTDPDAAAPPDASTPGPGLPPLQKTDPLMSAPLPPSGARDGALVAGYPASIAGPLPGSAIVTSALSTEGSVMQLTLVAVSSASVDELRAHYRRLWASLGMTDQLSDDGTVTSAGAHESLTLSVADSGTGNRYTIYGVFRTE